MGERPKTWRCHMADFAAALIVLGAVTGFGLYCITAGHLAILRRRWRWRRGKVAHNKASGHFNDKEER